MIDQDIQTKIDTSDKLLSEARSFHETSDFDESERCANEVLELLEPFAERDDLGEELDTSSQKYTLILKHLASLESKRAEKVKLCTLCVPSSSCVHYLCISCTPIHSLTHSFAISIRLLLTKLLLRHRRNKSLRLPAMGAEGVYMALQ